MTNPRNPLKKGAKIFDKYEVCCDDPIGVGSMWIVYLVKDNDGRTLCMKEYYPLNSPLHRADSGLLKLNEYNDDFKKRMETTVFHEIEMQNYVRKDLLNTSNDLSFIISNWDSVYYVSSLYDTNYSDVYYVLMDISSGENLRRYFENNHLNKENSIDILIKMCKAVYHLHSLGVLHLDLKEENIYVTSTDRVVLLDFGSSIIKGKKYSEHDIINSGIGRYTEEYAYYELINCWNSEDFEEKINRLSSVDERCDVFSILKIIEKNFTVDTSFTRELLSLFEGGQINSVNDVISLLISKKIAIYHSLESYHSLLGISKNIYETRCAKEYFIKELWRSSTGNEIIPETLCLNTNVIIVGLEGTGKTSILYECWRCLLAQKVITVYLDFDGIDKAGCSTYMEENTLDLYHIDINSHYENRIVFLCDNVADYGLVDYINKELLKKNFGVIFSTADECRECDTNEYLLIKIKPLEDIQIKSFFCEYPNLFRNEINENLFPKNIKSVYDLILVRKLKRRFPDLQIENISIVEKKYEMLLCEEVITSNKMTLLLGCNHFLPWLAINLYFNSNYLLIKDGEIFNNQDTIMGLSHYDVPLTYYLNKGLLKKEYIGQTYRIRFSRVEDYNYFAAKYLILDYYKQQRKQNAIICRFQIDYAILQHLAYLLDIITIQDMINEIGGYRYALRNLCYVAYEKDDLDTLEIPNSIIYDEPWICFNNVAPKLAQLNKSLRLRNTMYIKILEDKIRLIMGDEYSDIDMLTWKGTIQSNPILQPSSISNTIIYEPGINSRGFKKLFYIDQFCVTDMFEIPLLTNVKTIVGYESFPNNPLYAEKMINMGMYIHHFYNSCMQVVDAYDDNYNKYCLVRIENPMEVAREDYYRIYEVKIDVDSAKIVTNHIIDYSARYFKNTEYPLTIKGSAKLIAIGTTNEKIFSECGYRTFVDANQEKQLYKYAGVQFYIKIDNEWYRSLIHYTRAVNDFDVMDIDESKSVFVFNDDGRINIWYYTPQGGLGPNFNVKEFFMKTKIISFALDKESKLILLITIEMEGIVVNLEGEIEKRIDLSKYNINAKSLQSLNASIAVLKDKSDRKTIYIWSIKENIVRHFNIPFKHHNITMGEVEI